VAADTIDARQQYLELLQRYTDERTNITPSGLRSLLPYADENPEFFRKPPSTLALAPLRVRHPDHSLQTARLHRGMRMQISVHAGLPPEGSHIAYSREAIDFATAMWGPELLDFQTIRRTEALCFEYRDPSVFKTERDSSKPQRVLAVLNGDWRSTLRTPKPCIRPYILATSAASVEFGELTPNGGFTLTMCAICGHGFGYKRCTGCDRPLAVANAGLEFRGQAPEQVSEHLPKHGFSAGNPTRED
jgi:hypothetical protein